MVQIECVRCGKHFQVPLWEFRRGRRFCGKSCAAYAQIRIPQYITPEIRFWKSVNKTSSCWIWTAGKHNPGYGVFYVNRKIGQVDAHRFSWELHNGQIAKGLFVCHDCPGGDNPACVRPSHLFLGTNLENIRDASQKGMMARGEFHSNSKLTESEIREIRQLRAKGTTFVEIADYLHVHPSNIGYICRGDSWKHVS